MPTKERYHHNREHNLAVKKRSDQRRKSKISQWSKSYYRKNKDRIKAASNSRHWSNRERANQRTRDWHLRNPEQSKANKAHAKHRRRALEKKTAVNPAGIATWMRKVKSTPVVSCHWCQDTLLGIMAVFDHVIPISKGGPHTLENICVCCGSCNSSKKDHLPNQWFMNEQTFLKL